MFVYFLYTFSVMACSVVNCTRFFFFVLFCFFGGGIIPPPSLQCENLPRKSLTFFSSSHFSQSFSKIDSYLLKYASNVTSSSGN